MGSVVVEPFRPDIVASIIFISECVDFSIYLKLVFCTFQ